MQLCFCKLYLIQTDHTILFWKFNWHFETQSIVFCASFHFFWHNAITSTRIGSKVRRKTLSSWQKTLKSNFRSSQSTNQRMHAHSNWGLVDFHWYSGTRWNMSELLFSLMKSGTGNLKKQYNENVSCTFLMHLSHVPFTFPCTNLKMIKKSEKLLTRILILRTALAFPWAWISDTKQISGKSLWSFQKNWLPSFSGWIWNSAVFRKSVIDVWITIFCFMNNQSINHALYLVSVTQKIRWRRKEQMTSGIYFISHESLSQVQSNLFCRVQGRFLNTVDYVWAENSSRFADNRYRVKFAKTVPVDWKYLPYRMVLQVLGYLEEDPGLKGVVRTPLQQASNTTDALIKWFIVDHIVLSKT